MRRTGGFLAGVAATVTLLAAAARRGVDDGPRSHRSTTAVGSDADGEYAETPADLSATGWKQAMGRVRSEFKDDGVMRLGAAVAYYLMLAVVPGLVGAVSLLGLVLDPIEVTTRLRELAAALPSGVGDLVLEQADNVAQAESATLGLALAISIVTALFTASSGTKAMLEAMSIAYDEEETRSFVVLRATALALTVVVVLFLGVTMALAGSAAAMAEAVGLPEIVGQVVRFPLLLFLVLALLAMLYRYGPDRDEPEWVWVSVGSVVAGLLWLLVTGGFTFWVESFGSYDETYGSLAGVVVLLLWLQLSAVAFVLGAEVNAELERQSIADTTIGPDQPMGQRGAVAADLPPSASP